MVSMFLVTITWNSSEDCVALVPMFYYLTVSDQSVHHKQDIKKPVRQLAFAGRANASISLEIYTS